MHFTTRERLSAEVDSAVTRGFAEYNDAHGQANLRLPIAITAMSDDGERLLGALDGYISFDWLTVSRLFVPSDLRGAGLGTRLLQEAELRAKQIGCVGSTLATYDFQARPFYEKNGYEVFGTLSNSPKGHDKFFMRKVL